MDWCLFTAQTGTGVPVSAYTGIRLCSYTVHEKKRSTRSSQSNNVTNMCHPRAAVLPVQPAVCLFIIIIISFYCISFRLVKLKKATVQQQLDTRCPQSPIFRSKRNPAGKVKERRAECEEVRVKLFSHTHATFGNFSN